MKRLALRTVAFALVAAAIGALSLPLQAQEGTLRDRIRERIMQRQQKAPAPEANAEVDSKITKPGDYTFKVQHDGLTRMYRVHVPPKYNPDTPAALLVALHGGGGNMDYQANEANYGQISKSDREGFIALFPNGYSKMASGKFATWNAGKCCGPARDENIDDVGFIRQAVENVMRQMNIDRNRVYATGMSNGAIMAYRLACDASDLFRGIAPVAGTDNTHSCEPKRPVSVLHFHARNDPNEVFTGGAGANSKRKDMVTDFTPVPDSMAKWARMNGCSPTPKRVLEKPGAYCEAYPGCRDNVQVQLCVTETGGHSWPGAQKTRGEPASQAISANDLMWDFFSRR
jgi:polyhydroxybutyrate depolymerase